MIKNLRFLAVSLSLALVSATSIAAPNDTSSQYKPTNGTVGSVQGTAVQFQDASIGVRVNNGAAGSLTGTLDCIAMHD